MNNNGQTTSKQGLVVNSFTSLALDLQAVKSGSNPALTSGGVFLFTVNSNQPPSTNNQLVTDDQVSYLFSFELFSYRHLKSGVPVKLVAECDLYVRCRQRIFFSKHQFLLLFYSGRVNQASY